MVSATTTAPEMIGLLAWWSVVLAAPVVLVRRWRRRRRQGGAVHTPRMRRPLQPLGRRREAGTVRQHPATPTEAIEPSIEPLKPVVRSDRVAPGERPGSLSWAGSTCHAGRPDARPVRLNAGGLSSETLEPLCRYVDFRRRLELAARELAAQLVQLPADRWRIEPYLTSIWASPPRHPQRARI
jgi:hypothetical protein